MSEDNFDCHDSVGVWGMEIVISSGQKPGLLLNTLHAQDSPLQRIS